MNSLRLVSTPTRYRRLNEILGMTVLVAATLLLLALASYTPSDPSLDTVGGYATGRPAHNWTGMLGAYLSDGTLQLFGVAAFLLPLMLARVGACWVRSKPAGSPLAKTVGLGLWLVFGTAAIALLPGHALWRGALPVEGVIGRLVADFMILLLNLPGTCVVVALMVVLSLYLATTFTFNTAQEWATTRLSFVGTAREWWTNWRGKRKGAAIDPALIMEDGEIIGSKREKIDAELHRESELAAQRAAKEGVLEPETTLLGGLFSWWNRRRGKEDVVSIVPDEHEETPASASMWRGMPRTNVDAPPVTALSTAAAAAAPFAQALAAAAAPLPPQPDEIDFFQPSHDAHPHDLYARNVQYGEPEEEEPFSFVSQRATEPEPVQAIFEREFPREIAREMPREAPRELPAALPEPVAYTPPLPRAVPLSAPIAAAPPLPQLPQTNENISFGRRADTDVKAVAMTAKSVRGYKLPPSSLLFQSEEQAVVREEALREEAKVLVEKCGEFGVDGQVVQINPGPVVTTFEFRPDAGVKVARITGLADDLCLAMAAESILIERMAGKSTVGIQVPNTDRETIWLRDVVECESFAQSKSKLAIALGKDINGRIVTADLASMPHVLIAGSTGSGKSVAINAMIMSVLFKSTPEQVRMILVDPKRVELGMYEGIPHLFTPIITEAKLAANALRNAVKEMERRLKLLAANHVRNIDQFNKLFDNGSEYLFEDVNQEPLPYIIIIIDELADLMMLDRSNVEESITRLAQMARAVGIHLILATQRPSVDVITGLIKANVPTRMSFRLATKVDSRTIIDSNGAESLLGRGDMLYLPPGTSRLQRVHAPFVTEKEISAVTEFWRAQGEAEYVEGFLEGPKDENGKPESGESDGNDDDPMYDDAVKLVFEFGKASTSLLQRRLRIGYGRAAHLVDMMYNDGLVGPADGSKPRELLKPQSWLAEMESSVR
ncbi:DNA segregation ATPase FtsK/SpoIIIE, S-DNA-T family [Granulicella rosea]|uniref:DNA segregation ATPase FtsK/SpoIIIE, S-DNA-T family n=1 Tax=Granulicella rosea TaxID=474952 RepID=A0A239CSA3_9BACT|nr:DNA translocase FtsK [Granulicella rosea]SNS22384.1 DNA segregation ATPase FtsK/SpoIIIE, S-DNA-T family [Granulicella rosea]